MKNITEFIIERMSLQDESNILMELKVFGVTQNVDLQNSMV